MKHIKIITKVALVVLFCLPLFSTQVAAISIQDLQSIQNNSEYYWPTESGQCTIGPVSLVGNGNLQQIFNYFTSNGYSQPQAAGIVGNIEVESGGDPEIWEGTETNFQVPPQPDSTSLGWGIVQWTPASKILNYAQDVNLPAYLLSTQVQFLLNQLNGTAPTDNEQTAGNAIKQTTTAAAAAVAFLQDYERPFGNNSANGQNAQIRITYANQALALYGSSVPTQSSASNSLTTESGCGSGTGPGLGGSVAGCNFGSSSGPLTTSTIPVTTSPNEISVAQMCQNVQALVYNHSSSIFKEWLKGCGNPGGPNCAEGWCDLAVAIAWGYTGSGYASAATDWSQMEQEGYAHPGSLNPPVGALLFYSSITSDGHVGLYLGNNMVMSSDVWGPGVVGENPSNNSSNDGYVWISPESNMINWSPGYLGWSAPIFTRTQYQTASPNS